MCELLGWKRRTGSLKARECREFLEKLQSQVRLVLPAKRPGRPAGKATEVPVTARGEPGARLVGTARDLGEIRLQRVQRLEQRRLFRELVGRHHYLGHRVPFGAHLRYLVYSVGAGGHGGGLRAVFERGLADSGARPLDWMGGGDAGAPAGARGLEQSLFSVPWVQVKNLASRILSRAVRQLAVDWPRSYGVEVFLVETLVDPSRYRGSVGGRTGSSWGAPGAGSGRIG